MSSPLKRKSHPGEVEGQSSKRPRVEICSHCAQATGIEQTRCGASVCNTPSCFNTHVYIHGCKCELMQTAEIWSLNHHKPILEKHTVVESPVQKQEVIDLAQQDVTQSVNVPKEQTDTVVDLTVDDTDIPVKIPPKESKSTQTESPVVRKVSDRKDIKTCSLESLPPPETPKEIESRRKAESIDKRRRAEEDDKQGAVGQEKKKKAKTWGTDPFRQLWKDMPLKSFCFTCKKAVTEKDHRDKKVSACLMCARPNKLNIPILDEFKSNASKGCYVFLHAGKCADQHFEKDHGLKCIQCKKVIKASSETTRACTPCLQPHIFKSIGCPSLNLLCSYNCELTHRAQKHRDTSQSFSLDAKASPCSRCGMSVNSGHRLECFECLECPVCEPGKDGVPHRFKHFECYRKHCDEHHRCSAEDLNGDRCPNEITDVIGKANTHFDTSSKNGKRYCQYHCALFKKITHLREVLINVPEHVTEKLDRVNAVIRGQDHEDSEGDEDADEDDTKDDRDEDESLQTCGVCSESLELDSCVLCPSKECDDDDPTCCNDFCVGPHLAECREGLQYLVDMSDSTDYKDCVKDVKDYIKKCADQERAESKYPLWLDDVKPQPNRIRDRDFFSYPFIIEHPKEFV